MWLSQAQHLSQFSHAERLKVGAYIIKNNRVITTGINGTPKGYSNKCECIDENTGEKKTVKEVMHAELNAICGAAKNGIALDGTSLFVTHSPCFDCAKIILAAGIKDVYYLYEYRDNSSILFLKNHNVNVCQIDLD